MSWIEVEIKTHPIENGKWVKAIARIRNNETGDIRDYESREIMKDGDKHPLTFNWAENNFSCDCNRRGFFRQAGFDYELEENNVCGEGAYSVQLVNPVDGKVYYDEF